MKSYVGLDVHSKSSVFVIQNERGEELGRGEVPTSVEGFSSLRLRFRLRASTLVALESGTMAFFAARRLSELGLSPVVVDAREVRIKAHRPRQKSDTRDAVELCEGLRRGIYRATRISYEPRRVPAESATSICSVFLLEAYLEPGGLRPARESPHPATVSTRRFARRRPTSHALRHQSGEPGFFPANLRCGCG
jgi:hypothetical protein